MNYFNLFSSPSASIVTRSPYHYQFCICFPVRIQSHYQLFVLFWYSIPLSTVWYSVPSCGFNAFFNFLNQSEMTPCLALLPLSTVRNDAPWHYCHYQLSQLSEMTLLGFLPLSTFSASQKWLPWHYCLYKLSEMTLLDIIAIINFLYCQK